MEWTKRWAETTARVEANLDRLYAKNREPQKRLFEAMRYSLLAGGKRLRPFLVYEFCRVCGGSDAQADCAAMAVEMIHTYSLIHDDLPCMDNDDLRRGKPTNHKVFGEAAAVLAGDGLLTDAFFVLTQSELPAEAKAELVKTLSYRAGPYGMVGGQVLDMEAEERACTRSEVLAIQKRKTGALIRAACVLGCLAADADGDKTEAADRFALHLGLAFQIVDDILDVTSDTATLGKPVGSDDAQHKNTYVTLCGLDGARKHVAVCTADAVRAAEQFGADGDGLRQLAQALADRKK